MTKREAAVITLYTGVFIGDLAEIYKYSGELMGRPVFSHEFSVLADELKEKSKKDFFAIKVE
ncbi:MAG: hypothetical protein K2H90_01395 [Oscillospiraceae bacterium]|nr:hypothetical protein [Oscillospiraceae bacterium]